jgi:DNA-binding response OmpR family regulator
MTPDANSMLPLLVLIVVGDSATRQSYKQFLTPRGFVVEEAGDGSEALAKAASDPPDIIVTEWDLRRVTGEDLCGMLKEDPDTCQVPIVVLANGPIAANATVYGQAADCVLTKPCEPAMLLAEMKRVRDRSTGLQARAKMVRSAASHLVRQSSKAVQTVAHVSPTRPSGHNTEAGRGITGREASR